MESSSPPEPRAARYLERRVQRKGLRPRVAASVLATLWLIAIVAFGILEHLVEPERFDTVWLGMWWATQTVTTVGYGDVVPDQTAGRLMASILMIGGLSLFGVITGMIASAFVTQAQADRRARGDDPLTVKLNQVNAELEAIREQLAELAGDDTSSRPPAG